ncbi:MAG TPA: hypothetical protein ENI92_01770, partial [Bacteroidetes bacterium]|nr:hypothetical protein [Bacteroidota bacterium]
DGLLRFGSEVKAILADPAFPRSPDLAVLANYLAHYRLTFRGRTLFRGIHEVPPGCLVRWEGKRREEKRLWSLPRVPESEKEDPGEESAAEQFRGHLARAVRRRLMADVPVGAYLSGGLDSSAIVLLMKQLGHPDLKTFSIGFPEEGYNEFSYSEMVFRALDVPHLQVMFTEAGYFKELEPLIRTKDAPLSVPNEVPLRFLSRVLKKRITVVLSGEGADELIGGYTQLVRSPHDFLLAKGLEEGGAAGDAASRGRLEGALDSLYGRHRFADQREQFLHLYQWVPPDDRRALLGPAFREAGVESEIDSFWREVWDGLDGAGLDPYEKVLAILEEHHLSALLLRLDATTMAEGVEGRVPYTDRDLVEFVARLPVHYKVRWKGGAEEREAAGLTALEAAGRLDMTKYLLRLAFAGELPDEIVMRPKTAFPVPLDTWFYGAWHEWAKQRILTPAMGELFDLAEVEKLMSSARRKDEGMKLWMLANVGIWLQTYFG